METILNDYQTSIEDLHLDKYSQEVQDKFWEFFYNVPLIQTMVAPDRPRAKDLPRDKDGKIIVDITKPHIIEDSDYFRPSALHFLKTGKYTELRPNPNPNSEYGKWIREEVRRCREGYVRESDGEWITGDYYFFLNYCPMLLAEKDDITSRKAKRKLSFPRFWDGHYLKFHYLEQARLAGKHAIELASRQKGKSFCAAGLLTKRFELGESADVNKKVTCYATAAEKGYLVKGDQTLDKFQYNIDFLAQHTEFPRKRLINTIQNMQWVMGYQDLDTGARKGTLNAVMGVTAKDDESKLRGTRGVLYIIEEAGSFPRLIQLWGNMLPSVEDGDDVYGMLFAYGTSGDSLSDFYAMSEMMYHPDGYHVYATENVYDMVGKAGRQFAFFFPGYMNRANCYDRDGNSDVTKALLEIILDRNNLKYNSTDASAITKRIAEIPIVPQEAILRTIGNMFPVAQLSERIGELDADPNSYSDIYIGTLTQDSNGEVKFTPTYDTPIRNYPLQDNKDKGALEIFNMPEKDNSGKVFSNRYIIGYDPVNNDRANTASLSSIFVFDLFTDKIVAEYTGRTDFSDDSHELVRKLCLFYNAKCLYENNVKGCYAYFSSRRCLHLLADTPEYLIDKQVIKTRGFGNTAKGVGATTPINNYADRMLRDWLLKPNTITVEEGGEYIEKSVPNLYFLRNRALLRELCDYNPEGNFDRIRAMGMVMLYRGQFIDMYEGDLSRAGNQEPVEEDDYFKHYDEMIKTYEKDFN